MLSQKHNFKRRDLKNSEAQFVNDRHTAGARDGARFGETAGIAVAMVHFWSIFGE